ncbi:hypothetical protein [Photorhabdus khanii]|uniref:Uncharacterized protein n=1 Tax=Photorhabdus khanii subsp. guanajuatensis TaxID=2100166 RepID=A0A4R4IR07_9GAMM|nr:hypothetical protein [Photorhabdus khanii]TDB42589.1 hypothetical protein C5467_23825 [Photorhabdus khanii subsp. guanajuatensis]
MCDHATLEQLVVLSNLESIKKCGELELFSGKMGNSTGLLPVAARNRNVTGSHLSRFSARIKRK